MRKKDTQQPTEPSQKAKMSLDGSYPGLNMLSWSIGYLEQFLAILSEPLLIVCAAIAVIDFMTSLPYRARESGAHWSFGNGNRRSERSMLVDWTGKTRVGNSPDLCPGRFVPFQIFVNDPLNQPGD